MFIIFDRESSWCYCSIVQEPIVKIVKLHNISVLHRALYSVDVLWQYTQLHSSHSHLKTVQVHQNKSQHNSAVYPITVYSETDTPTKDMTSKHKTIKTGGNITVLCNQNTVYVKNATLNLCMPSNLIHPISHLSLLPVKTVQAHLCV